MTLTTRIFCSRQYYVGQKILVVIVCQFKKKKIVIRTLLSLTHYDYRLDYERYFLGGKFQNSKLFCHFYYTERLPQVIYVLTIALIKL
jgi:hypothetical protein